jgi:hypothetical protein
VLAYFDKGGTIRFGVWCNMYRLDQLAKLEIIRGITARSATVGHVVRQKFAGLVYVHICAAFASVVFIGWLISLVIW